MIARMYQYRIYPNKKQIKKLEKICSIYNQLWNIAIDYRKSCREDFKITVTSKYPCSNYDNRKDKDKYPMELVNTYKWLSTTRNRHKDYYGCVPADSMVKITRDIDAAYDTFFSLRASGDTTAKPPDMKYSKTFSFIFKGNYQFIELNDCKYSYITIPSESIGKIKVRYHRRLPPGAKLFEFKISKREGNRWYVYIPFTLKEDIEVVNTEGLDSVGIDLGIRTTLSLSDGSEYNQKNLNAKTEKIIADLNRQLSTKVEQSSRWTRIKRKIGAVYTKNERRRKYWWHNITKELSKKYSDIYIEELELEFLNTNKNKSVRKDSYSVGFGYLRSLLGYKAPNRLKLVDPYMTSKMCCQCGLIKSDLGSNKEYVCSECGLIIDRDLNAALNIYKHGLYEKLGYNNFKNEFDLLYTSRLKEVMIIKEKIRKEKAEQKRKRKKELLSNE